MSFKIIWKGNEHTNKSSRGNYAPTVIVNHISGGSMGSMDNWFTSPGNQVSSAHFGISKEGVIHQYVKIEDVAWHAGIKLENIKYATAKVVRDMKVNPNQYSIGIEHEGFNGDLTPKQLEASIWLHKYIQNYVKRKYNKIITFDKYHVIGHFQVDPKRKPYCPGPKFPWAKLYEELAKEDVTNKPKPENKPIISKPIEMKPKPQPAPAVNIPKNDAPIKNETKIPSKPIEEKPKTQPVVKKPNAQPTVVEKPKPTAKPVASKPKPTTKPKTNSSKPNQPKKSSSKPKTNNKPVPKKTTKPSIKKKK